MHIFIAFTVILSVNFVKTSQYASHGAVDCSMGSSSCESCHAAYPFCYWCNGECKRYFGKNIANIECRGKVMYERCEQTDKKEPNVEEMLKVISRLKKEQSKENEYSNVGENRNELPNRTKNTAKKVKLMRLLKLLKMLAYLEKAKQKNHGSHKSSSVIPDNNIDNENEILKLGENPDAIDKSIKTLHTNNQKSSSSDLDALIKLVGGQKATKAPEYQETKVNNKVKASTENPIAVEKVKTKTPGKVPYMLPSEKIESTKLPRQTSKSAVEHVNTTVPLKKTTRAGSYCELFEQEDECNGDQDCSWCNILDLCIGRNKEDFKHCTGNKRNAEIAASVSDTSNVCTGRTSCASCTKKGKCYWCEKTKSCHIYPFFGFIPHNCPTNMWYYKECDVQLAIFIILFPLLMILLSMAIFYVCLRYCYYRRKTLKVQLFEKPEIFEKRKGKKVYFVGGDDEDEESRSEQIRKKYNLPQEKEPLISP